MTARARNRPFHPRARGFTLIELLVVLAIIGLVSVLTLPLIFGALEQQQLADATSLLQATLVAARDSASRANAPQGVRFFRDETTFTQANGVLAYSSMVAIELAPDYSEGTVSVYQPIGPVVGPGVPSPIIVYGPTVDSMGLPLPPTSWYWNVRLGEKIRINDSGPYYTVVGPYYNANAEGFVNAGNPGDPPPAGLPQLVNPNGEEFLYLSNGRDDNHNGITDEGFDEIHYGAFYEQEQLVVPLDVYNVINASNVPPILPQRYSYTITRRPVVADGAKTITLPQDVVIDATSFDSPTKPERSRLPVDPLNREYFDLIIAPNGQVVPNTRYAGTSTLPLVPFYHFWLTEREGVHPMTQPNGSTVVHPRLPMPKNTPNYDPTSGGANYDPNREVKFLTGERRLLTLFLRSGLVTTTRIESFDGSNVDLPYIAAQEGVKDPQ